MKWISNLKAKLLPKPKRPKQFVVRVGKYNQQEYVTYITDIVVPALKVQLTYDNIAIKAMDMYDTYLNLGKGDTMTFNFNAHVDLNADVGHAYYVEE